MKPALDLLLWAAWMSAALSGDGPGLALTVLVGLIVVVARHDWARGVRPFDKIDEQ